MKIIFNDDKEENFICDDFPAISDWITIYQKNFKRIIIPKDGIKRIEYSDEKKEKFHKISTPSKIGF